MTRLTLKQRIERYQKPLEEVREEGARQVLRTLRVGTPNLLATHGAEAILEVYRGILDDEVPQRDQAAALVARLRAQASP